MLALFSCFIRFCFCFCLVYYCTVCLHLKKNALGIGSLIEKLQPNVYCERTLDEVFIYEIRQKTWKLFLLRKDWYHIHTRASKWFKREAEETTHIQHTTRWLNYTWTYGYRNWYTMPFNGNFVLRYVYVAIFKRMA